MAGVILCWFYNVYPLLFLIFVVQNSSKHFKFWRNKAIKAGVKILRALIRHCKMFEQDVLLDTQRLFVLI